MPIYVDKSTNFILSPGCQVQIDASNSYVIPEPHRGYRDCFKDDSVGTDPSGRQRGDFWPPDECHCSQRQKNVLPPELYGEMQEAKHFDIYSGSDNTGCVFADMTCPPKSRSVRDYTPRDCQPDYYPDGPWSSHMDPLPGPSLYDYTPPRRPSNSKYWRERSPPPPYESDTKHSSPWQDRKPAPSDDFGSDCDLLDEKELRYGYEVAMQPSLISSGFGSRRSEDQTVNSILEYDPSAPTAQISEYIMAESWNRTSNLLQLSARLDESIKQLELELRGNKAESENPPTSVYSEKRRPLAYTVNETILAESRGKAATSRSLGDNRLNRNVKSSGSNERDWTKADHYANSRLPPSLVPFKAYIETWRLLCLAAQYSNRAYDRPTGAERNTHFEDSVRAMVIKSVPIDDKSALIIAIRGSKTLSDWIVNFRREPTSPDGFLDDAGNLCHSGFLSVAREMIQPVTNHLVRLLSERTSRSRYTLLFTGHSAGGAVASLLYMHMLSCSIESPLTSLMGVFKRIHCVIFGAPPVSLIPLQRPNDSRHAKSMFLSFVNQGDLVVRASTEYVASLAKLHLSPVPKRTDFASHTKKDGKGKKTSQQNATSEPVWEVPPSALSNAGRLVLLRKKPLLNKQNSIEACCIIEEDLRPVVFGDPAMHAMSVYMERIEQLAKLAITGKGEQ